MLRIEAMLRRDGARVSGLTILRWGMLWLAATMLAAVSLAARADEEDLPGRVGRIAEFAGQLYLSPEERATDWASVGVNYPVTSGDNLWVSSDGRAEVDYGGGQFRLAGDTNLHVSRLDDRQLALFIDVDLEEFDFAGVFVRKHIHDGSYHFTGSAPVCIKIDYDRDLGFHRFRIESFFC